MRARLFGHVRRELEKFRRRITQIAKGGFEFLRRRRRHDVKQLDLRAQVGRRLRNLCGLQNAATLHDDHDVIIRLAQ